ncbi:MAG TPA: hypothetical protein GXX33_07740 [Firmicutes bacterium]|uniref:YjbH domain-containing protein n=2 Tax=Capillibacterium thermochitinicola TaxID=2699427 RepID=A0A8J6I1L7_9FIRM|nr:YjbH domain-containing protein [Capillibacterium thermochitinicola]HHW12875.1 hypothetical protein [Bacillota bacterium]
MTAMKRGKFSFVCLMVLVFLLGSGQSVAAKGLFGGSDFINTPTNRVLSSGTYTIGAYVGEEKWGRIQVDFGLVTDFEVGAAIDMSRHDNEVSARFKYRLIPETKNSFGLALGIQDIGKEIFSPYVVIGHVISPYDLRWNFGLGGGQLGGIFFGLSKVINPKEFPQVTLIGEYDAYDLNLGAKILLNKNFHLDVAVIDMDQFVVGITITP